MAGTWFLYRALYDPDQFSLDQTCEFKILAPQVGFEPTTLRFLAVYTKERTGAHRARAEAQKPIIIIVWRGVCRKRKMALGHAPKRTEMGE